MAEPETTPAPAVGLPPKRPWHPRRAYLLLTLAVLFWLLLGPWPARWSEAVSRLTAEPLLMEPLAADLAAGPLTVGVSVIDLTADHPGAPLAGYGERVFLASQGTLDPVAVKVLVFDNGHEHCAVVAPELLLVNTVLAEATYRALNPKSDSPLAKDHGAAAGPESHRRWTKEQLFFAASHTHAAPGGYPGSTLEVLGFGHLDEKRLHLLARRLAEAVHQADANRQPSEWARVSFQVEPGLIRNRTVPTDKANDWLDLVTFRHPQTQARQATLAIFSAHPTTHDPRDPHVTGDYPGVLCRELSSQVGGAVVFAAGAVGSMAAPDNLWPRGQVAEPFGQKLAALAAPRLLAASPYQRQAVLACRHRRLTLPDPQVKLGSHWRLSPVLSGLAVPAQTTLAALRLGDCVLLGTPCDYSGVLALELRDALPGCTTIVTSFNGDYIGYVLPDDYYDVPRYEPQRLALHGRHCGACMQAALMDLGREVLPPPQPKTAVVVPSTPPPPENMVE